MSTEHRSHRSQVTAEAAHWFATMQQVRVPETERVAFARWLSQSALNVQEYLAVASTWRWSSEAAGGEFAREELVREAKVDLASNDTVVLLSDVSHGARQSTNVRDRMLSKVGALLCSPRLAISALLAVLATVAIGWSLRGPESIEYRTHAEDQLTATLPDGSTVRLNTGTQVRVRLTRAFRDVELLQGEALFTVAKDKHRPFRVTSLGSEIRAVGTAFNVDRRHDVTTVTVLEGQVEVAPVAAALRLHSQGDGSVADVIRLAPTQQARVAAEGRLVTKRTVDVREITAWTHPMLKFSDEPLRDVIAEFNRYNTTRLVLNDDELGAVRVSGVFSAADIDSFLAYLDQVERVTVELKDPQTRVIQRDLSARVHE
jgi:transmembrane sensor